jgi:hypothetical protein
VTGNTIFRSLSHTLQFPLGFQIAHEWAVHVEIDQVDFPPGKGLDGPRVRLEEGLRGQAGDGQVDVGALPHGAGGTRAEQVDFPGPEGPDGLGGLFDRLSKFLGHSPSLHGPIVSGSRTWFSLFGRTAVGTGVEGLGEELAALGVGALDGHHGRRLVAPRTGQRRRSRHHLRGNRIRGDLENGLARRAEVVGA